MKNSHAFYMDIAERSSWNSYAIKMKVGAVIVKNDNIIAYSYNGTPRGFDNNCEDGLGRTLDSVVHAEMNCICKCAKSGYATEGAIMYSTHSPCPGCARAIIQSGIIVFIYRDFHKSDGLDILHKANILAKSLECVEKNGLIISRF